MTNLDELEIASAAGGRGDENMTQKSAFTVAATTETDNADRSPCQLCGRKFLTERLDKHIQICSKIKEKKRKQFDSVKQRGENLDQINKYPTTIKVISDNSVSVKGNPKQSTTKKKATAADGGEDRRKVSENKPKKESDWRAKHEEFIRTIRAARGEAVETVAPSDADHRIPAGMVECPTCGRRFSERAAERHVTWCAEHQQKDEMKRKNSNTNTASNQEAARERMKARTKYKPPSISTSSPNVASHVGGRSRSPSLSNKSVNRITTTRNNNNNNNNQQQQRARRRSTTSSTSSYRSNTTASSCGSGSTTATNSTTVNIARKYTRNISKSSENLSTRPKAGKSPGSMSMNDSKQRTNKVEAQRNHRNATRTISEPMQRTSRIPPRDAAGTNRSNIRRNVGGGSIGKMATSKIDTGLSTSSSKKESGSRYSSPTKPPAVPVMKFKEKFPHHQQRINSTAQFDSDVLRRNSSAYDDSPKTVPGVRTGGISPTKNREKSSKMSHSRSEMNLNNIGGDIKTRIDRYISGLYDNDLLNNYTDNFNRFVDDHRNATRTQAILRNDDGSQFTEEQFSDALKRIDESRSRGRHRTKRSNSIASEEARGSTSDSTDSGLGVYNNNNNNNNNGTIGGTGALLVDNKNSGGNRSENNFAAREIMSPPMSEMDRRSRLLLRNGSLNDIHLIGGGQEIILPSAAVHERYYGEAEILNTSAEKAKIGSGGEGGGEMTPRFCHSCGTKYPNTLAKFCYECGNSRFSTAIT